MPDLPIVTKVLLEGLDAHPNRILDEIRDESGMAVGSWEGYICDSAEQLSRHINLNSEDLNRVFDFGTGVWPLSFLKNITVDEDVRRRGYGSLGLSVFAQVSKDRQCRVCLTRIGWAPGGPGMEKTIEFYRKNCWVELFEIGKNGRPDRVPLSVFNPNT